MSKPAYLIDASIYIFQSYFSPHLEVYSPDGREISAFYGYAQFLLRFLRQTRPRYVMSAFDESLFCGFRHDIYEDYKCNRALPDEELARQLLACAKLSAAMGVSHYGSRVFEADDIIGTVASRIRACTACDAAGISIVTRDKDLAQVLMSKDDHLFDFNAGTRRFADDIYTQYGVKANQFADYLALVGDAVDSIPGVPGIGPVAAKSLLEAFTDLDSLYQSLDRVSELKFRGAKSTAKRLAEFEEQARLSKQLATIVGDIDSPEEAYASISSPAILWRKPDIKAVAQILEEEGFQERPAERFLGLVEQLFAQEAG
ncbi:MAG: 5'-3' exonuclease H3TH domain-containing protein [Pseudohongiellaceae bacterium]|nr:5'-3' exonuclease H3TH domain-containing protein [Pseudohongiellaceae bacterium]